MEHTGERRERKYAFFTHIACEYFPCHEGISRESFNCLFCYCPLYAYGADCGGNFRYTKNGIKDCSLCTFPHERENYEIMTSRIAEIQRESKIAGEGK